MKESTIEKMKKIIEENKKKSHKIKIIELAQKSSEEKRWIKFTP